MTNVTPSLMVSSKLSTVRSNADMIGYKVKMKLRKVDIRQVYLFLWSSTAVDEADKRGERPITRIAFHYSAILNQQ